MARSTAYKKEYCDKIDEFLEQSEDDFSGSVKEVNIPTIAGLANYIGVVEKTIHNWTKEHPEFLQSLGKLLQEQKRRLQQEGLAGNYNSTIAKLILSANHDMKEKKDVTSKGEKIGEAKLTDEQYEKILKRATDELNKGGTKESDNSEESKGESD